MNGATRSEWATTLGAGGIFVETDQLLRVGTHLELRFRVPFGDVLHRLGGRVAWVTPTTSSAPSPARSQGIGIEFRDAAATAQLARELERDADPAD